MRSITAVGIAYGMLASLALAKPPSLISPLAPLPSGQTRNFNLELTWGQAAPDGRSREMFLINGEYPGPRLEMNQGDEVQILLTNKSPYETTMHFHGIEQYLTPWSDGVPGVSQRLIKPGQSFLAQWKATQYGSYWYHSHDKGQINDGFYGAIKIHPKSDVETPFESISSDTAALAAMTKAVRYAQPLLLSDHRHRPSDNVWDLVVETGIELPCFDSLLFNGKGRISCWSSAKIASLLSPAQKDFVRLANLTNFSPKGCMPAKVLANVLGRGTKTDISLVPSDIFDVCTATDAEQEVIKVTKASCEAQKWLALDIIGSFGLLTSSFSIDGLSMWVYAVDGHYIVPQRVQAIHVTNGDRYSVLVQLEKPGDYTMRMASIYQTQLVAGMATIEYRLGNAEASAAAVAKTTPTAYIDDAGNPMSSSVTFYSQKDQKAFPPMPVGQHADQTFQLALRVGEDHSYNWALNNTILPPQINTAQPFLFSPRPADYENVTISTLNNTWVDLILVSATVPMPPHPIHKHNNKMFLLGQGIGKFTWATTAEAMAAIPDQFNLVDPPMRDGFATLAALKEPSWMVVRYKSENPGAWLLHCHIESHLQGGMAMIIQDGINTWPQVPVEYSSFNA